MIHFIAFQFRKRQDNISWYSTGITVHGSQGIQLNKTGSARVDVTGWCLRVITFAVEDKCPIVWFSVRIRALIIRHTNRIFSALYCEYIVMCVLCPICLWHIIPRYLIKGTIFGTKSLMNIIRVIRSFLGNSPGNCPKRNKLHLEHGESLKTRNIICVFSFCLQLLLEASRSVIPVVFVRT